MCLLLALVCSTLYAAPYPLTVTDLAGRQVTIAQPPQRLLLQDSNDLLTLALLEREAPLARIVAWDNNLASSDPSVWKVVSQRWPVATQIEQLDFPQTGAVDIERLLRTHPDLIVARLSARPAIENSVLDGLLQRLGIPLLYVDNELNPLTNVPKSVALLGQVLNRNAEASAYLQFYQQRLARLTQQTAGLPAPKVFIEVRAGQAGSGACCHTQGHSGWGLLAENLGAINLGSRYAHGESADVALETLILSKPDLYVMTGTQRQRNGVSAIPFGYGVDQASVQAAMQRLLARPGFASVGRSPTACSEGLNHQFYNSVFNIVGAQWLAKLLWPETFKTLNPDDEYRHLIATYTTLPDLPFVFHAQACLGEQTGTEP